MKEKVVLGADHAGYALKQKVKEFLINRGYEVIDVGCNTTTSCDYPEFAKKLCKEVLKLPSLGILICGSGIGMSICANRTKGIRAALCFNEYMARMSRRHNNANVLCLGSRVIGEDVATAIVESFLQEKFEGGRHLRRIELIDRDL